MAPLSTASLSPREICRKVEVLGRQKINKSLRAQLLSGILGGAYIAFAAVLSQLVIFDSQLPLGMTKVLAGAVFVSGLVYVMVAGADLFTGSVMTGTVALMGSATRWRALLANLGIIYGANTLGALLVAGIVIGSGLPHFGAGKLGELMIAQATMKSSLGFWEALIKGIGCNWLVCLGIWMAVATGDTAGKILACFFPVMTFVALGFEHSIANMYFIPTGMILNALNPGTSPLSFTQVFTANILPVSIGNIIGGALFAAAFYVWTYKPQPK